MHGCVGWRGNDGNVAQVDWRWKCVKCVRLNPSSGNEVPGSRCAAVEHSHLHTFTLAH
jgi:hypothetical protein